MMMIMTGMIWAASSDWDEYDEDGTHYTDFPEKYGYDRDYFS